MRARQILIRPYGSRRARCEAVSVRVANEIRHSDYQELQREAWVWMCDLFLPYPFQNNIKFLPKPVVGVNGNGMHTNVSISKGGKFEDAKQPRVGEAAYPYTGPSGLECMPTVTIDDFAKLDLRIARIVACEKVPRLDPRRNVVLSCWPARTTWIASCSPSASRVPRPSA